jgi:hypothetical protein
MGDGEQGGAVAGVVLVVRAHHRLRVNRSTVQRQAGRGVCAALVDAADRRVVEVAVAAVEVAAARVDAAVVLRRDRSCCPGSITSP